MRDSSNLPPWFAFTFGFKAFKLLELFPNWALPPPVRLVELALGGLHKSQVIVGIDDLGIADALGDSAQTAQQLAATLGIQDADKLCRLLTAAAAFGVLAARQGSERSNITFRNNALSAVLRKDHPNTGITDLSVKYLLDITMLVAVDGKERTEQEFSQLLQETGVHLKTVHQTRGLYRVVEALPTIRQMVQGTTKHTSRALPRALALVRSSPWSGSVPPPSPAAAAPLKPNTFSARKPTRGDAQAARAISKDLRHHHRRCWGGPADEHPHHCQQAPIHHSHC
ncbi:MAG: hypothetical protein FRX49_03440 [Trebouxia sp. A1-2]|nr:MAG: hypothetical protein FRX49_03440 [Trebouxia sp. A1-2]